MTGRKKPWIKSAFSSLDSGLSNDVTTSAVKKSRSNDISQPERRSSVDISYTNEKTSPKTNKLESQALSSENWIEFFTPMKIDDLAVHSKKVEEIQEWFKHCDAMRKSHPAQICLLTGPTGSGKTAAIKLLARDRRCQIQEWINPIDKESITRLGDQTGGYISSQVEAFKSFLLRASRYKSLLSDSDKRLLLVEDFPNALLNDPVTFISILDDYLFYGKAPVVFIVADSKTKQLNISFNLFPDDIKNKYNIKHISFNPVATTLLTKSMKRFCTLMGQQSCADVYKAPQPAVIDSIVFSSQGDIRNALINLHFASLKGAPSVETKPLEEALKSRGKKKYSLKTIGCDESVTMFHALGRVFNPKYNSERQLTHSPASLVELMSTEPKNVVNIIHANYLTHFSDIENLIFASDGISLSDVLLKDYREETLASTALHIAVGSVMVNNLAPTPGWKPVRGPRRINIEKPLREKLELYGLRQNMSGNLFNSEYKTYIKLIPKPLSAHHTQQLV